MRIITVLFISIFFLSCKTLDYTSQHFIEKEFELFKVNDSKGILVLFPCFPCDAENTKQEFPIIETANKQGVSVLLMNYNQKLYLKNTELKELTNSLNSIFDTYKLNQNNIFIGGFSGGGNVTLLLSNYLIKSDNKFVPKGVFIVDSPIDLLALYRVANKNIKKNFSQVSVDESNWIINSFDEEFGNPSDSLTLYNKYSPFTFETKNIENAKYLKQLKIRFYTEPDLKWWKENRNNSPEDLNAFYIDEFYKKLKEENYTKIELIKTEDKGYRLDGTRHPHSWSIVDKENLVKWILQ